jgi:hypothetical protein
MPTYGSANAVKAVLRADVTSTFNADQDTRITALLALASNYIESQTGAQFGVSASETIVIDTDWENGETLFLPKGIRSVTSITENPSWAGSWTGGTAVTSATYRLTGKASGQSFYRTITRTDGSWAGNYVIIGVWEDQYPTVPDDVTWAVNTVVVELFKKQQASPAGQIGPDGSIIPLRDVFQQTEIRTVVDRYRVGSLMGAI